MDPSGTTLNEGTKSMRDTDGAPVVAYDSAVLWAHTLVRAPTSTQPSPAQLASPPCWQKSCNNQTRRLVGERLGASTRQLRVFSYPGGLAGTHVSGTGQTVAQCG